MAKVLLMNPSGKKKHKAKPRAKKLHKKKLYKHKKKAMIKPRPNPKLKIKAKKIHRIKTKGDTTMAKKKKNPHYKAKRLIAKGEQTRGKMYLSKRNPDGLGLGLGLHRPSFGLITKPNPIDPKKGKKKGKRNPGLSIFHNPGKALAASFVHPFSIQGLGDVAGIGLGGVGSAIFPSMVLDIFWAGRPKILKIVEPMVGGIVLGSTAKVITKNDKLGRNIMLGGVVVTVIKGLSTVIAASTNRMAVAYKTGVGPALAGLGATADEEKIRKEIEAAVTAQLTKGGASGRTLPYETTGARTLPYETVGARTLPYELGIGQRELAVGEENGIASDTM